MTLPGEVFRLAALLAGRPLLAARTRAALRGDLPIPDLEERTVVKHDAHTALRLPSDLMRRADRLVPKVAKDPVASAAGEVTRAAVIRLALALGMDELERRYAGKGGAHE